MPRQKIYKWVKQGRTDAEFVSDFAKRIKTDPDDARRIIREFINSVRYCTGINTFLNIRRLGTFTLRQMRDVKYLNRATGIYERIPLIYKVCFKPATSWRDEVNDRIKSSNKKKSDEAKELARTIVRV